MRGMHMCDRKKKICDFFGRIYSALTYVVAYANILHNATDISAFMRNINIIANQMSTFANVKLPHVQN